MPCLNEVLGRNCMPEALELLKARGQSVSSRSRVRVKDPIVEDVLREFLNDLDPKAQASLRGMTREAIRN